MNGEEPPANPFVALADETRLGVLEAIGDASGDGEYTMLSYSEIRDALGGVDPGTLNYHLRQLRDRFVERTDDGYRLTMSGVRVYQAVVSGSFDEERSTVQPVEVAVDCNVCENPVTAAYRKGRCFVECEDCDILYRRYPLAPHSFDHDSVDDLVTVEHEMSHVDSVSMYAGVCPYCSGTVERDLSAEDRAATNGEWDLFAHLSCIECGWFVHPPVEMIQFHHHATATFLSERGYTNHWTDLEMYDDTEVTVLSTEPWRVEVEARYDGDVIRHVVDGDLQVVDWEVDGDRPPRGRPGGGSRSEPNVTQQRRDGGETPFALLADETRLGVLEAIGDASGGGEYATLSYSTIRDALGGVDSGKLNYHLRQLRGRFVERTDDGYRLMVPGIRVYQAVSSGRFEDDRPTLPAAPIDTRCPECDERLHAAYEDGLLSVDCPDCSARYHQYPLSPGAVDGAGDDGVDDGGADGDGLAALVRTGLIRQFVDLRSMRRGICPYCSGYVARSVFAGSDADSGSPDEPPVPTLSCTRCRWSVSPSMERLAAVHHATATFFERHGRPEPAMQVVADGEWTSTVASTDPLRVEVSVTLDDDAPDAPRSRGGDTLRHVVDGDLNVVEWAVVE